MDSLTTKKSQIWKLVPASAAGGSLPRRLGGPLAALIAASCAVAPGITTGDVPGGGKAPTTDSIRIDPVPAIDPAAESRLPDGTAARPQTMIVRVTWPSGRSLQVIPNETTSIRLTDFGPDGSFVASTSVSRPPEATSSTVVVPAEPGLLLPIGNNTLLAEALDGAGAVLASGSVVVAIRSNRAAEARLTLESAPTPAPTVAPTANPTAAPTANPTAVPTANPTAAPTANPTATPTANPTATPTAVSVSMQADAASPIYVPGTGDGVALNPSSLGLSAIVLMSDGSTVSEVVWSTSAAEVATVNLGLVTAVQVGTASITAFSMDGQVSSSYLVEVRDGGRLSVEVN